MATASIGTDKDFATVAAWWAALDATVEGAEVGEVYGVLAHTGGLALTGKTINGSVTLQAAPGEGLNSFTASDPLKYTSGKGGALAKTGGLNHFLSIQTGVTVRKLQIVHDFAGSYNFTLAQGGGIFDSCLFDQVTSGVATFLTLNGTGPKRAVNCAVIARFTTGSPTGSTAGISMSTYGTDGSLHNCTVLRDSDLAAGGTAFNVDSGSAHIVKNCLALGPWSTSFEATGWDASSSHNGSFDTANPGGNSLDSLTAANEVESISDPDARAKTGNSLAAGTRDDTFTADLDIIGQARSTSTPYIGCFELQVAGGDPGGGLVSSKLLGGGLLVGGVLIN